NRRTSARHQQPRRHDRRPRVVRLGAGGHICCAGGTDPAAAPDRADGDAVPRANHAAARAGSDGAADDDLDANRPARDVDPVSASRASGDSTSAGDADPGAALQSVAAATDARIARSTGIAGVPDSPAAATVARATASAAPVAIAGAITTPAGRATTGCSAV